MRYLIHACPRRMWYVEEFIVPSLRAQGIREDEIEIWNDAEGKGNLFSCMESFRACGERAKENPESGTWHLQDDILICRDFAERTRELDDGIVCGYCCKNFGNFLQERGRQPVIFLWYSFPCIRIPDRIAGECAEWFFTRAVKREKWKKEVEQGKSDDWFFRNFLHEQRSDMTVLQLDKALVEHVDWLIGGTIVNPQRTWKQTRAAFWQDEELVKELEEKLNARNSPPKGQLRKLVEAVDKGRTDDSGM